MPDNPNPAPDEDPWLTVPQVSEELKLHPATVRVWINNGRLAAVRAGRTWRVRRSEVDRALLSDASPAYLRQEASPSASTGEPSAESSQAGGAEKARRPHHARRP